MTGQIKDVEIKRGHLVKMGDVPKSMTVNSEN